jgi:cobalt-zinc-cadmium efflux system outer membrane protein
MTIQPKRLCALVVAAALTWSCNAAEPMRITPSTLSIDLPTAIRLALEQPAVRAAAYEVSASEATIVQAGRLPNPELEYLREGQQAGTRTTTVQINQPIELGGKRQARVALAQGAVGLAKSEQMVIRQQVRSDVIVSYYEVLVGQQRQELARALGELARESVEVASKRVAAGKISPIDETKARLAAIDAATELNQATAQLGIARTKLGALIGKPADSVILIELLDQLPQVKPLSALLAQAEGATSVQRARSQLAAREAQTEMERAARVPDLTLSVGSQRDDQIGKRQAIVGLSVPLPLFNRNEGNLRAALRRTDKAREELAAAQVSATSELAAVYTRFEAARNEVALLRQDVLPNARSAYELTLKGFEYGKFPFLEVLDAQRTWFQAQSRQWNSMLEAYRAYADIERIAGTAEQDNRETK